MVLKGKALVIDILEKLIAQGGGSYTLHEPGEGGPTIRCKYRFGGRKCAAGHCLPDGVYHLKMEGASCDSIDYFRDAGYNIGELCALQIYHDGVCLLKDNTKEVEEFKKRLDIVRIFPSDDVQTLLYV